MIKLTKVEFITSGQRGHNQRLDRQLNTAIWVNPLMCCHFEHKVIRIGEQRVDVTDIQWPAGYCIQVTETPQAIMSMIKASR